MRTLLSALLASFLLLSAGAPGEAAEEVGLSRDGSTWRSSLDSPLFDPAVRWVPGDRRAEAFHVRNQGASAAELSLAVRSADEDRLWARGLIRLRARAAGGAWHELRNGALSPDLTADALDVGESVRVEVEATFLPDAENATQERSLDLDVRARLTGLGAAPATPEPPGGRDDRDDAGAHDDDGDDDESDDAGAGLPHVGTDLPRQALWLGGLVLVMGAAFVAAGRREQERDDRD